MSDFIGIDIQGITTLNERLKKLPKEAQDLGTEEVNEYIVNMMQQYPPKPNKPFQWSSDKQRKYVMMKIRNGEWSGRTQELRNGWKKVGKGYNQIVVNEVPHAQFVQGGNQIRGHKANDWKTIEDNLKARGKEILKKFEGGVKTALRKLKLN
jgi:hypothetical protein